MRLVIAGAVLKGRDKGGARRHGGLRAAPDPKRSKECMRDITRRKVGYDSGKTATLALLGACLGAGLMGCAEDKPSVRCRPR